MVSRVLDRNVIDRSRGRSRTWVDVVAHVDVLLVAVTLTVSALGVLMVYSATRAQLVHQGSNPLHYLERQAVYSLLGLAVMVVIAAIDYHHFEVLGYAVLGLVVVGLLAVFAIGHSALGAQRWIQVGPVQIQPSAFAALALVLAVAAYCHRHREEGLTPRRVAALMVMAAIPAVLVVKQPDLGSAIIMVVVLIAMLVVAGVKARYLAILGVLGVVGIVAVLNLGLLKAYQVQRLNFIHPTAHTATAYTLKQSKIAIASGNLTGTGLFDGTQTNLGYVPEQYTDFIFTAVGEQLGFAGAASLLGLFAIMVWRLLRAAQMARDQYGRLLCAGVLAFVGFSVFQNAGMTMGIMPITGIPLPFVSYGGSATIAFFAAIGLALNVGMRRLR
ncbi:MAG: rod shape-determining protein RodA [Acidimicrobiales bacterium]